MNCNAYSEQGTTNKKEEKKFFPFCLSVVDSANAITGQLGC